MNSAPIALYLIFQVFFGLTSWQYSQAMKMDPVDLSRVEMKLWRENTILATVATIFLLIARLAGVAFLLLYGYRLGWTTALVVFGAGLVCSIALGAIIRKVAGSLLPALIGYPVMLITGVSMWFAI